jgi:hypothetical protein
MNKIETAEVAREIVVDFAEPEAAPTEHEPAGRRAPSRRGCFTPPASVGGQPA